MVIMMFNTHLPVISDARARLLLLALLRGTHSNLLPAHDNGIVRQPPVLIVHPLLFLVVVVLGEVFNVARREIGVGRVSRHDGRL